MPWRKRKGRSVSEGQAKFDQALVLYQQGQLQQAFVVCQQVLALQPQHFDALHLAGVISGQLKDAQQSLSLLDQAIAVNPHNAQVHNNRGNAWQALGQYQVALDSYSRAIALDPNYARAYYNRGVSLQKLLRQRECLANYERAIALEPDFAGSHWNRSLCHLQMGNFELGWPEYEWRWKKEEYIPLMRTFSRPLWLGAQSLQGKTLFMHEEQGFGDTLQFCRYAKLVHDLGARVILGVQQPLFSLLQGLEGVDVLITQGHVLPAFDYHCPLLSLPLAFKTNLDTIPAPTSYIKSNADKVAQWQARLGEKTKPRVGLVCSGRPTNKDDHNRSIALADLITRLPSDVQYVSLQQDLRATDQAILQTHPQVLYFGDQLKDFSDTAALCELMDLVISVDTSVAHLAGGMGKSVWILLPFNPDWRWLLDRSDSPWYPSAKLYRQEKAGDWSSVLKRVATDLSARAGFSGQPDDAQSHFHRGNALRDLRQNQAALQSYDSAIALDPNLAPIYYNRGNTLSDLGQYEQAVVSYDRAISLQPGWLQAHTNRGNALRNLRQGPAALASYERALAIADAPEVHWNQALCYLQQGDFFHGWPRYEARWQMPRNPDAARQFAQPLWRGQSLQRDQCLLVWGEQGLGDQVLCLSMLPSLMCRVAQITVAVEPRLVPLVQRSFPQVKAVALDQALAQEPCDRQISMMSLGQYFRKNWQDFPKDQSAYLSADAKRVKQLREKLTTPKPLVCGISWRSLNPQTGAAKSVSLQDLAPLFALKDFEFVDLQYGDPRVQRQLLAEQASADVMHIEEIDNYKDLDGLAALIAACDVVITVSNTTAHLAAALGKPVYLLLPYANGLLWYWHEDRADSPWYPTARLYRQEQMGDWSGVVERVAADVFVGAGYARDCLRDAALDGEKSRAWPAPTNTPVQTKLQQGLALDQQGQFTQAQELYEQVLALQPDHFDALQLLGGIAYQTKQYESAVQWMRKAIASNPNHAIAYNTLGLSLAELGQYQAALESYDRAIALNPNDVQVHIHRAVTLQALGQHQAAIATYSQAIALDANCADAHFNLGLCYLQLGAFEQGWLEHEWRWKKKEVMDGLRHHFTQPPWSGVEPLQGKTIFLYSEQGLGDTLHFCRYAKLVRDLGARVVLGVQQPLLSVLGTLPGVDVLLTKGHKLPAFDCHCPLLSLPLALQTRLDNIPAPVGYIKSHAAKVTQWQAKLGEKTKSRVGLVWSGNPQHANDSSRSIALTQLLGYLPESVQYVSLQKEVKDSDRASLHRVVDVSSELQDFADTAALCELMDLVISVDTSVAHLAGAMGKPVWVLLSANPDWRWLLDRSDSPWYPTARLYRQEKMGDWAGVVKQVAADLVLRYPKETSNHHLHSRVGGNP